MKFYAGRQAAGFTTDIDTKRMTGSKQLTPIQSYDAYSPRKLNYKPLLDINYASLVPENCKCQM